MSDGRYIPRSARRSGETLRLYEETLTSGVPEHLETAIFDYVEATTSVDDLTRLEASLRHPITRRSSNGLVRVRSTVQEMWRELGDDWLLDVLDHRLYRTPAHTPYPDDHIYTDAVKLGGALRDGGSAYEVVSLEERDEHGRQRLALEDRVSEEVRAAATEAMAHGKSGDHLRKAWGAVYGRSPDPTGAYREAVRAVEVAAAPVVTPKDGQAELGKIVSTLRDAPDGKFVTILAGKYESADTVNIVKLLTQLLHTHDHKRHGNPDVNDPIDVAHQEAVAAVHLAVLLVQWFESGFIEPVEP